MRLVKDRIRTSLWFAPSIAVVAALVLGFSLASFDPPVASTLMAERGPDSARELLSTIASSMLTFTALVFSITVLVLQLASNQFSPRVIRTFLESRVTKLTMSLFVGTFVYTIIVLSQIRTTPVFVPAFAMWLAVGLVLVSVGVFIEYIHHIAHSVRAISVIRGIATETRDVLDEEYPTTASPTADCPLPQLPDTQPVALVYHTEPPGVVAAADLENLVELARSADAVLEIVPRIGDFVPTGAVLLRVWKRPIDGNVARASIAIEPERTPVQDVGFGIRQLVDIAVRALSPGINDPTTAMQSIDHLHDLLRRLASRPVPPATTHSDETGTLRLKACRPTFAELVDLAFDEIFHYGSSAPAVRHRLRRMLVDCLDVALPQHRRVLRERLALLEPRAKVDGLAQSVTTS